MPGRRKPTRAPEPKFRRIYICRDCDPKQGAYAMLGVCSVCGRATDVSVAQLDDQQPKLPLVPQLRPAESKGAM